MKKSGVIVLIVASIVFLAIGFYVGQTASAVLNTPGSEDDPLVAQSYVESLVGERTAALQTQIDELQKQIEALAPATAATTGSDSTTTTTPTTTDNTGSNTTAPTTTAKKTVEVTAETVNIRSGPSTDSTKIASAVKGDKFEYVSTQGDWYQILLQDGTKGWVASWLTKLN